MPRASHFAFGTLKRNSSSIIRMRESLYRSSLYLFQSCILILTTPPRPGFIPLRKKFNLKIKSTLLLRSTKMIFWLGITIVIFFAKKSAKRKEDSFQNGRNVMSKFNFHTPGTIHKLIRVRLIRVRLIRDTCLTCLEGVF